LNFDDCVTVPTNTPYKIMLQPGWNQVGNPFLFEVPLSGVTIPSGKKVEKSFWGWSTDETYQLESEGLSPWVGYFIKNNETDSVEIQISPISKASLAKTSTKSSSTGLSSGEWKLEIGLNNITKNQSLIKASASPYELGIMINSKNSWDENDVSEPPKSPNGTKSILNYMRFPHNDWTECQGNYIRDYRSSLSEGQTWELEIEKSSQFISNNTYEILLDKQGDLPDGFKIMIHDLDKDIANEKIYDGGTEISYKFTINNDLKKIKILVGTVDYISKAEQSINEEKKTEIVSTYLLSQNYPNPFNPGTRIEYQIPKDGYVSLIIYNTLGQQIQTLISTEQTQGKYSVEWNPNSAAGGLPSGIYYYRLQSGDFIQTKKMLYLR
jgi:hypothetical protein